MMIAAFPEAALTLIVTEETEAYDAIEVYRDMFFEPDMMLGIHQALDTFAGKIESIFFYGPESYTGHLIQLVQAEFPQMKVGAVKND